MDFLAFWGSKNISKLSKKTQKEGFDSVMSDIGYLSQPNYEETLTFFDKTLVFTIRKSSDCYRKEE